MSAPQYDARNVLEQFLGTYEKLNDGAIHDVKGLPHPKDVIKSVLQLCIRTIEDADKRRFLRSAYLSLANYQPLTEEERKALSALRDVGPPAPARTRLHRQQVQRINDVAMPLHTLMVAVRTESAVLAQELRLLPGADDQADPTNDPPDGT
jgi:hypothetical protein